jgi:hypothetical protein
MNEVICLFAGSWFHNTDYNPRTGLFSDAGYLSKTTGELKGSRHAVCPIFDPDLACFKAPTSLDTLEPRKRYTFEGDGTYTSLSVFRRQDFERFLGRPIDSQEDAELIFENLGYEFDEGTWNGAGRWFQNPAKLKLGKRNIVIITSSALDI